MKKRGLSMILALAMIVSLFSGLSLTAYAGAYVPHSVTISPDDDAKGYVTYYGGEYDQGDQIKFYVHGRPGYQFKEFSCTGIESTSICKYSFENQYYFYMPNNDVTITAVFEKQDGLWGILNEQLGKIFVREDGETALYVEYSDYNSGHLLVSPTGYIREFQQPR